MLKPKADYKCTLLNTKSGEVLLKFKATASSDLITGASFVGGGVASASQNLTIYTEEPFLYKANAYSVMIDGIIYMITSVQHGLRRRLGAHKYKTVYILTLE